MNGNKLQVTTTQVQQYHFDGSLSEVTLKS